MSFSQVIIAVTITLSILVLFVLVKWKLYQNDTEHFYPHRYNRINYRPFWWPIASWFAPMGGRHCRNCGDIGRGICSSCVNCVYAINESGFGQCVPGDKQKGPYFQEDAIAWQ